jgi:hypothetical protein
MNTDYENKNPFPVSNKIFQQVYDSPHSLFGKHKWVTAEEDVRAIEIKSNIKQY